MTKPNEDLLFEVADGVATLTFNRPEKRNAFTTRMYEEMRDILQDAQKRDDVKVLVVTGNGAAFCAGSDIEERLVSHAADQPSARKQTRNQLLEPVMFYIPRAFHDLGKPTIAAVNGVAAGAGLGVTLLCDIRIAAEKASFVASWINIGLHPDLGASFYLPRVIGTDRALRLLLSGEPVAAREAERMNLVTQVVPDEDLPRVTTELARKIAQKPSAAVELTKQAVSLAPVNDLEAQLFYENYAQNICFNSEDFRAAIRVFLEKRS